RDGFLAAASNGSTNNDAFAVQDGQMIKRTNHSGGVLGGISDGSELIVRAAIKPTPSIARPQSTVNIDKEEIEI
ncbi:chorismate synthase, partial [Erysipelatoclostridium ramosum]|uniref:chorismate synthase n=1 Tax=Thomasclavelia ramosa TaxID=1547 RepID=UPI001D033CF0|nr:chorismate synthase [Thomasclavelia ramosa]